MVMIIFFFSAETWTPEETQRVVTGLSNKTSQPPYCGSADRERERGTEL